MSSIFEELGISQDRAGFNAFGELDKPFKKFERILEAALGEDVTVEDIGSDLDVWIRDRGEEYLNQIGVEYNGRNLRGDVKADISPSSFNRIVSNVDISPDKAKETVENGAENVKQSVTSSSGSNKLIIGGAVAVVGGAYLWSTQ